MNKNILQFANQSYLNLETFRKNGEAVRTPVWFVQDGDTLYVRTVNASGKVKRIRNNGSVKIMPCGRSGEPLGEWVTAQGSEMTDTATAGLVQKLLVEKYAEQVAMFEARTKAGGLEYTVLHITLGA